MNTTYPESKSLESTNVTLSALRSGHRNRFIPGHPIRLMLVGMFAALLIALLPPDAFASCVINKTDSYVWVEYYGTRLPVPTFDRGGQWLKPGQIKCLKGRGGDWLLLSPDWLYGKSTDWSARETRGLGGTSDRPRFYCTYVTIGTNDTAEVAGFQKFSDPKGWWVRPYATYRSGYTPNEGGGRIKGILGQLINGLAEAVQAHDGDRLTTLANQYYERGEYSTAEAFYREAFQLYERQLGKHHWRTAVAASSLGACLTTLQRYEEAEPHLVDSFKLLKSKLGIRDQQTQTTLNRLIRLYESAEAYDAAAEYRALLP